MSEEHQVVVEEVNEETPADETAAPKVREPSPFKDYFSCLNKKMSKYKRQESKQNITDDEKKALKDKEKYIEEMRFILKLNGKEIQIVNRVNKFTGEGKPVEEVQQTICNMIATDVV